MLEKLKKIFKKHSILISVGAIIFLIFVFTLSLILRGDTDDPSDSSEIPKDTLEEFLLVDQPLGYNKNYKINFSDQVLSQLREIDQQYLGYSIKDSDHLALVRSFVEYLGKGGFTYSNTQDNANQGDMVHYWEGADESVSYNIGREFLFMRFNQPTYFSEITFNPRDEQSIKNSLEKLASEYFPESLSYRINDISIEGNFYRVEFQRLIDNVPLLLETQSEYLLLTPDGRVKEAAFFIAELQKHSDVKYSLIPANDLRTKINQKEYPKRVNFRILDLAVEEEYTPYGYFAYSEPFTQKGNINFKEMEMVYFYTDKSQVVVVPTFLFEGDGDVDVEGLPIKAEYTVVASAIESKYVFVHPESFFRNLE